MKKTVFRKLRAQNLIENYNRFRKTLPSKFPKRIFIWDETLIEGENTPTVFLTYSERVRLAKSMDELGVSIINLGFPGFSENEKDAVRRLSNENFSQARLAASARTFKADIDACLNLLASFLLLEASFLLRTVLPNGLLFVITVEGLNIGGWVFLWKAISTFIFKNRDVKNKYLQYRRLSHAPILFKYNTKS